MTWFRVDDSFHDHPKLSELEDGPCFAQAVALWTVAGCWSARHLTDGFVPKSALRKLVPYSTKRAAEELLRVGLWAKVEGGFRFHDWSEYQPSRDVVQERRAADAERKRKARSAKRPRGHGADSPQGVRSESALPVSALPDPTRPVPIVLSKKEPKSSESPATADVARVFETWKSEHWAGKGPTPKLTATRRSKIQARLREGYTVDQLEAAIRGVKRSRWHMGENPDGKRYTGLQTLLRDGEQVEKLGALLAEPPRPVLSLARGVAPAAKNHEFEDDDPDEFWRQA